MVQNDAMLYEGFVRKAFSGKNKLINKSEDPAGLANADLFNSCCTQGNLLRVKIGIAYSIIAYNRKYYDEKQLKDPDDYNKLEKFVEQVWGCEKAYELINLIEDYKSYTKDLPDSE